MADLSGETIIADVIETYVPVRAKLDGPLQVFEIYQDAPDTLDQVRAAQRMLVAVVIGVMLLLFVLLYLIVRRADQIIARQTIDLQVANAQLCKLERLKSGLTHTIVHDMKSPLTCIMGYAELLPHAGPLTDTQVEDVRTIVQSVQRLLTMIVDLANISFHLFRTHPVSCVLCAQVPAP